MHIHTPSQSSESEWDNGKMAITYFSNEFPREDLQDIFRRLAQHSKDASHPLLARFITLSTRAVKDEIQQLRPELRELIPTFDTILTWAENTQLREGLLCGAIDGVLLVIAQIGAYIGYVQNNPEKHGDYASNSLAALGVGLLSCTAVALASNSSDLPLTGADAIRLAFRMGIHVHGVSESLEARDMTSKPDTWAYVVHDVQVTAAQKELDAMHARDECAETNKIFISAVSRTSITVSGPPARLKDLFNKCKYFRNSKFIPLPVYGGLCHAPHVYGNNDTQRIIYGSRTPLSTISRPGVVSRPVYSTSTGLPYSARRASELLECVITELLTQAIHWDNVIGGITASVQCSMSSEVILNCFNDSIPLNDLSTALSSCTAKIQTTVNNLMSWIFEMAPLDTKPSGPAQSKLAIVGMSCRLPGGATNTEKFWEILEKGLDVSRRIPADRFDIDTHYDPTGKQLNKSMTQYGCFIDSPGLFDAPFFNMSPREAQVVDPQMRLSLVTAYEALEQSGYVGNRTPSTRLERIGTYYGQAADDYREVNQGQEVSTYYIPGGCRAFGPGRINYFFKFAGPSYSIDTACSSGLAAIEIACQALWKGDVDTAIAGGVNVLTNPDGFSGLCNGHFLTKGQNACKTWCETADGYCRADGVGSVVIKRLEDAEADNDNVLGVILAAGTNHSAEAVSITHPHAGHQAYLSRQILRQACVNPLDVSYVELHGTGTQAGDFEEMSGMMEVYAPLVRRRGKDQPLHIGGVKSNIGHGESAAGTAALVKVLIMLQKNAIPPHIGIKSGNINPRFPKDFNKRNLHIPFEMTPWKQAPEGKRRIAAINNFGAAGGNTMMLLEEAPARAAPEADQRNSHVVSVSAKTKASLTGNIASLLTYLENNDDVRLADLAYTTTARRYQHSFRVAVSASDIPSLKKQLTTLSAKVDSLKPVGKSASPPVAFAFTGQGASHKSMNLELYHDVPTFREHLLQLDSLATAQGFPSFIPAIDGSHAKDHAHSPVVTQLALTCTEMALAKYWSSLGIKPDLVIGHSLGEYAALHVAGVISANDAIFMVGRRAQMLEAKCKIGSHTMMAVRASLAQIEASAESKPYTVACINGPGDTVLSGTKEEVNNVALSLEAAGYRCIKLDVAFAFHSEQTDPILDDFELACKGCVFSEPKLPVVSPLLGKVVFDGGSFNANYMRRSTREAVNFVGAMENAQQIGAVSNETVWLEMGPHPVCVGFVKSVMKPLVAVASMRREDSNWKTISDSLASLHQAGIAINWSELHRPFESGLRLLDLPTYSWNEKNYWLQYNGDWCLTKGNTFYNDEKTATKQEPTLPSVTSEIQTSTVQQITDVQINGSAGTVVMQSDLMQPDFLAAAHGHRMNDCGVVTSSIHADIAYTLGNYLYKKLFPKNRNEPALNMANLVVTKGLVANSNTKTRQLIQVTATTADINSGVIDLTWQTVDNDGTINEPFASANLFVSKETTSWLASWEPIAHLIHSRIEALDRLAAEGKANRFSRNMAYTLFASNLVDYAEKYRGMQSVVMHELEAYADVQLSVKESGTWTVAPYYIDSVAHLAGFIMNCSDAMDAQKNYCVTPGWKSMRFAEPLLPGAKYRSYVKMIPSKDGNGWFGDVYIMREDGTIVGMVGGIEFHSFPRILLPRFFSPPDKTVAGETKAKSIAPAPAAQKAVVESPSRTVTKVEVATPSPPSPPVSEVSVDHAAAAAAPESTPAPAPSAPSAPAPDSISSKALLLIANEAGLELEDLADDVAFADLGVDSLMSLVLSEKFRSELDVKVSGSLFLDFPNVGDLRMWLEEYYS